MKTCAKMVKRRAIAILSVCLFLIPLYAVAEVDRFCDEIPQDVRELDVQFNLDGEYTDCIVIEGTSLGDYCFVMTPWRMNGYLLMPDGWENRAQVSPMSRSGGSDPFFHRHSADNASNPQGALGQVFANDLGFDIVRKTIGSAGDDFELLQYHWLEDDFRLVGWQKPGTGQFTIWQDSQWAFYNNETGEYLGSARLDFLYEYSLAVSYDDLPATLEEAKKMEDITEFFVESLFPGWTMCSYANYNSGHGADAGYYRVENGLLTIRRVSLNSEKGIVYQEDTMPVPVSEKLLERLQTEDANTLIDTSGYGDSFLTEDPFDRNLIPVPETILQNDMQTHGLLLLTESENGVRHIYWVKQEGDGYDVRVSQSLPSDASLDLFHGASDEISLEWNRQYMQCAFAYGTDGRWSLDWVMGSGASGSEAYSMLYCGIFKDNSTHSTDGLFVGTHPWRDLFTADLAQIPASAQEACASLDRNGWAVVNNPDPAKRLHLRTKPDRSSASMGKFYNCTPVQVLEQQGDWSRVRIGLDGHLEGWMLTRYLAFGSAMDNVVTDIPSKTLREQYILRPMYTSATMQETTGVTMVGTNWIVGVVESELYILLDSYGNTGYMPQDWFWEGNG